MDILVQITAQCHENYGAHNWNGQGECPQAWKPKGCQVFTLRVNSDSFLYAKEQSIKAIETLLEGQSNNHERFIYVDHELIFQELIALDSAQFEKELQNECEKAFN